MNRLIALAVTAGSILATIWVYNRFNDKGIAMLGKG